MQNSLRGRRGRCGLLASFSVLQLPSGVAPIAGATGFRGWSGRQPSAGGDHVFTRYDFLLDTSITRCMPTRREIIALGLTNAVVNRGGPAMAVRLAAHLRRPTSDVAPAFMAAREVFDLPQLWQRIDALDGRAQGEAQLRLYEVTQDLVNSQTQWFLRDGAVLVGPRKAT